MKVLNLYAGIGGNRKLWGGVKVTAVELKPDIAAAYKEMFPDDEVIVGDAHEYLREHFRDFDFIWASPPCPTHSRLNWFKHYDKDLAYPDMKLYQEIILLKSFYNRPWVIENVKPYYNPLIEPSFTIERHNYWSSHVIPTMKFDAPVFMKVKDSSKKMAEMYGYDLELLKRHKLDTRLVLRNAVTPEVGKYIFDKVTQDYPDRDLF